MTKGWMKWGLFAAVWALPAGWGLHADGAPRTVETASGMTLGFGPDGAIGSVRVDDRELVTARRLPFSVQEYLPPRARHVDWGAVPGTASNAADEVRFSGHHEEAALAIDATCKAAANKSYIAVSGEIRDLTGLDRALCLTFTLPLDLDGWRWHSTAFHSEEIKPGKVYPGRPSEVMYLDRVGPRKGRDPMDSGLPINKLPYTVVSDKKDALALAYPTHEPRAFLVQAREDGLSIRFSLGLSAVRKASPSRASFRFILYRVDPEWHIRSASERYRHFYPELFASSNRRHGNSTVLRPFSPENQTPWPDNTSDFGIVFGENDFQRTNGEIRPRAAEEAERLNLIVFHWRGPWYYFHSVDKGISHERQMAILKAQAEGRLPGAHGRNNQLCGCPYPVSAKAAYNSHLVNAYGQLDRQHYPSGYG